MVVVGTRPEVVKMAPVVRALQRAGIPFCFVHSGQHYDYNLSLQFVRELGLPEPDVSLRLRVVSPALQTGRILSLMDRVMREEEPSAVLVEGDTNTVLAAGLAGLKLGVRVGHVEAGLRSFDLRMPEELNRRLTDHLSTWLYAPTETSRANLERESVMGKIYVTGNTVIDAVEQHLPIAERSSKVMSKVGVEEFILATIHRAENVDDKRVLKEFVNAFTEAPLKVVLPLHPRTRKRLHQFGLWRKLGKSKNVDILAPAGYLDFLVLMRHCKLILTDSGGIQEEATAPSLRKRVVVMRKSTERPEAVEGGFAILAGTKSAQILKETDRALTEALPRRVQSPFGDGESGERIVGLLNEELGVRGVD
jgi:UDP-N-acetylglucosamine 2-epimerase (non-hydrolysing)